MRGLVITAWVLGAGAGPAGDALARQVAPESESTYDAAGADDPAAPRVASAVRVDAAPRIDGRLDEAVWDLAEPLRGFVQREPVEGAPASQRTEVRILYDDEALYIGAWLYDSNPAGIVIGERRRNAYLRDSDAFLIILDTFHDRQNGFVFGTNPSGIEYDGHVTNEGRGGGFGFGRARGGAASGFNINWDGNWSVATSRDQHGWYAEFRIPFATLRYGGDESQTWGLNMARYIRRNNEEAYWSPLSRQFDLFRLSQAGTLTGIHAPAQRLITVIPYALASAQRQYAVDDRFDYPAEIGGDMKLGVTRSLTLDLTVNTDFAQVEVDDEQVDLSRFRLFFPEKRPFFLENAGLFDVGSAGSNQVFFSRRIGIGPGGQAVPIRGGARLTGRTAGVDVGLLNIWTGALDGLQDPNRYTVARLARELPNRSRIGGIFTERMGSVDGDHNRVYAVDGRLGIGETVTLEAMAAGTSTPGLTGRESAYRFLGDYRSRDWMGRAGFDQIGESYNPEVGFISRAGYRGYSGFVMHYYRTPGVEWLRELRPHVSYNVTHDFGGFKETERVHLDSHIALENGAFFSPAFDWVLEGFQEPFAIAPDVVVAPGTYSGWQAAWRFNTNEGAPVSLRGGIDVGSFLSGSRRGGSAQLNVRHGVTWAGELGLDHHRIDLAEGDFDVTLVRLRLAYSFSPSVFVQSLVQYSDQANQWSGNLRFGWINAAGTGLYVVYNERQGVGHLSGPLERALIIKYTHFFDFTRM